MAASKVGSTSHGGSSGTAVSFPTSFAQTPTTGNLLILVFGYSKGSTGNPTISGVSGWTLVGSKQTDSGALNNGGAFVWVKKATASETAPTVSSNLSITGDWTIEEWSGLDLTTLPLAPTPPFAWTSTANVLTAQTINSNTRTTTQADEFLYTFVAGHAGSTGNVNLSFGGGATAEYTTLSARGAFSYIGTEADVTPAGTVRTHTASVTTSTGGNTIVVGTLAFTIASYALPTIRSTNPAIARSYQW